MKLGILFLTYAPSLGSPRAMYAQQTLDSLFRNLCTSASISMVIADDGSPEAYQQSIIDYARNQHFELIPGCPKVEAVTLTDSARHGYGRSFNIGAKMLHGAVDHILVLEDDWEMTRALNIDPHLRALETGIFGCIRFGYLGTTQTLLGHVVQVEGCGTYWLLHADSPEPHVFSGHPRLESVAWQQANGPWPEGLQPGETEFAVAQRVRDGIVWPAYDGGSWVHIGSVRARSD